VPAHVVLVSGADILVMAIVTGDTPLGVPRLTGMVGVDILRLAM